jgi:twitching motility protein PilT
MPRIDAIFRAVKEIGATDLHIATGSPPMLRVNGELRPVEFSDLSDETIRQMFHEIMSDETRAEYERQRDADFAYELTNVARVRCNVYEQRGGVAGAFRILPNQILTFEQLGLPPQAVRMAGFARGLVLVTGPPGSGKSSTLAAILDHVNRTQRKHIITIEDPIEYVHQSQNCLVNQREVGVHTRGFAAALRAALREDPDIVLVGELRDLETIELAVTAAETGQMVYGTLHTMGAHQTVDRIIDAFADDRQQQIRIMLSESLRAVFSQRLLPRADREGRAAACEIMFATPAIAAMIRDQKTFQIPSMLQTGKREGMLTMDDSLAALVQSGTVAAEEAARYVTNRDLVMRLRGRAA